MGNWIKLFWKANLPLKPYTVYRKCSCIAEIIIYYQIIVWLTSYETNLFLSYTLKLFYINISFSGNLFNFLFFFIFFLLNWDLLQRTSRLPLGYNGNSNDTESQTIYSPTKMNCWGEEWAELQSFLCSCNYKDSVLI